MALTTAREFLIPAKLPGPRFTYTFEIFSIFKLLRFKKSLINITIFS